MEIDLTGKAALVTGAAGGIGKAICELLTDCGAGVAWCDLPEQAEQIRAYGIGPERIVSGDVSSPDEAARMVDEAAGSLGGLDILVNCAGINAEPVRTADQSLADWKRIMDVNLQGTYLMCQAAGRVFCRQSGGSVVNISSAVSLAAVPADNAYGVAKAGVNALTKTLALEWARHNVRVNCIVPGCIDAGMFRVSDPHWRELFLKRTPMGRFGTPQDVAGMTAFLVSGHAAFVTGVILPVDGGWVAYGGLGAAREGR